jgi:hypothetical protein
MRGWLILILLVLGGLGAAGWYLLWPLAPPPPPPDPEGIVVKCTAFPGTDPRKLDLVFMNEGATPLRFLITYKDSIPYVAGWSVLKRALVLTARFGCTEKWVHRCFHAYQLEIPPGGHYGFTVGNVLPPELAQRVEAGGIPCRYQTLPVSQFPDAPRAPEPQAG